MLGEGRSRRNTSRPRRFRRMRWWFLIPWLAAAFVVVRDGIGRRERKAPYWGEPFNTDLPRWARGALESVIDYAAPRRQGSRQFLISMLWVMSSGSRCSSGSLAVETRRPKTRPRAVASWAIT